MGLTLTRTVVGLVILTPILIFFNPILIPLATVLFVVVGGFGLETLSSISWIYNYINHMHPLDTDQIDYACMRIADTTSHVKDYDHEYNRYL